MFGQKINIYDKAIIFGVKDFFFIFKVNEYYLMNHVSYKSGDKLGRVFLYPNFIGLLMGH
jgi:hypothetical protein